MGISIHISARELTATRRFNQRSSSLAETLRHISSGVKSRASDLDGATLAISERITSALQGAKVELRNVAERVSLVQTLESGLSRAQDALIKMRELAVSAGRSHLSLSDREAIEGQFRALMAEVEEISSETKFNGRALLSGDQPQLDLSLQSDRPSLSSRSTQDALGLSLPDITPEKLGRHVSHVGAGRGVFLSPLEHGDLEINGVKIRNTIASDDTLSHSYATGSAIAKARAINASTALTGVSAEVDINLYRGFEAIRGVNPDEVEDQGGGEAGGAGEAGREGGDAGPISRWIKINGAHVSLPTFMDSDGGGALREAVNQHFAETGVIASVDAEGKLILAAPDGRNMTLELSDVELRNALGIRDVYGDDVNFSPDVDPPEYLHHGDIESVSYVSGADDTFQGAGGVFAGNFTIVDNKFTRPRDRVDYVFEVVRAGALGEALVRVKEESIEDGASDAVPEDYLFNDPGAELDPPTPNKVRVEGSQYYGGSEVRIGLKVISAGSPESAIVAERPRVEVFITSLDDPTVTAVTLGTFRISNDETIDLSPFGLDAQLSFPVDEVRSLLSANGVSLGLNSSIPASELPPEHDYDPIQPIVRSWDGIHTTAFEIEVIESGHAIGEEDYDYTDAEPALIRVTADVVHQGRSYQHEYRLEEEGAVYPIGVGPGGSTLQGELGLVFPSSFGRAVSTQTVNAVGDYRKNIQLRDYRFVGEETREYDITFTSDGVITHQEGDGGPSARVDVYSAPAGQARALVQSYTIDEVNADRHIHLGEGDERDGFVARFYVGPSLTSIVRNGDQAGDLNFYANRYNDTHEGSAVIRITKAGIDHGPQAAEYEYFYADDPDTILDAGSLSKYTTFSDGTRLRSWVARSFRSNTEGIPNNVGFVRDRSYTSNSAGHFESEVIEVDGVLTLESVWNRDTNQEQRFYDTFQTGQYHNVGNGLEVYIYRDRFRSTGADELGFTFEADVSPVNRFEVGDTFSYDIEPNIAQEGDSYTIRVEPVDLAAGAKWTFTAVGPDWKPDDVYYADLGTGFEPTAFTLTDTLQYPTGTGEVLGEISVAGAGRLEVGDQIRVQTRAFVGEVRTSGAYTNPAFPTDYILKVTRGGAIGDAELSWERADGLLDTEHGGRGVINGLSEGEDTYLEEGVSVSFHDLGEGLYLAEGDEVRVSVGRNLKYTFGGQVSLHSREAIEVNYRDSEVDRQLGKITFNGTDEEALSPRFHDLSDAQSTIHIREESSLARSGVLSLPEVQRAIRTIDVALEEVNESQVIVGAAHSRLEQQQSMLIEKVMVFSGVSTRITGVDYAEAVASRSADQISLMSAPQLMQLARVNALRVLDLVSQPALSFYT